MSHPRLKILAIILTLSIVACSLVLVMLYFRPGVRIRYHEELKLERDNSPLHDAINKNLDYSQIKVLIDKFPLSINQRIGGATPLHEAVTAERADIVELLLKRGAEVDSKIEGDWALSGDTPLLIAVRLGNKSIAQLLIDAGASLDVKSRDGKSLEQITAKNMDDAMRELLETARRKHSKH